VEDETKRILDQVAEGTLTVDEAVPLLEALRQGDRQQEPAGAERPTSPASGLAPAPVTAPAAAIGAPAAREGAPVRTGPGGLSFGALVELKQQGVTADFVRDLAIAGYTNLSAGTLVELRQQGVDARFIYELRDAGFDRPSPGDLV